MLLNVALFMFAYMHWLAFEHFRDGTRYYVVRNNILLQKKNTMTSHNAAVLMVIYGISSTVVLEMP